ncbi:MAG: autotransporter outer membrane beta-barrel domain-containing protein [Phascolarctobacterium sp.]|nr:autotransporter outer membrane beta-barrel domain-containing protein [Phascolarctobacterium sp.]
MYCDENDTGYYNNITIEGDITMTLGADAMVDFGTDKVLINANSLKVNVLDTANLPKVYLSTASLDNQDTKALENKDISVVAAGDNNTGNATADLGKLAGVVVRNTEEEEEEPITGATLIQEVNGIYDGATGTVAVDENGNATVEDIVVTKNSTTFCFEENNALSLITWRAEINDMNKRMGELRNANGEHGIWVRMVRGEDEYESINHQYNQYQLGYDEKLSVDPSWTVGVALSYTEGDSTYSTGSAENKHKGFSVYGSKLNDDGTFIDLIAKYARLENDLDTTWGTGDYSTNCYSLIAEFVKRIQQGKGVWVEPQVELTYGKVSAVDYKIGNVAVAQDGIESLVGRVGFSLGKDIKQGNVYARASYLYDFDGETSANFVDTVSGGKPRTLNDDLGGGWWEVGVGANINLSKATYIYADVEKTFGGEVDTNWQWNLGVRYSF